MGSDSDKDPRRASTKPVVLSFLGAVLAGYLIFSLLFAPAGKQGEPVRQTTAGGGTVAAQAQTQAADQQQQQQQQQQQRGAGRDMSKVQQLLETRVCGSPAVDGYAHVEPPCLEGSPTNKWWQENKPRPDDLDIWIEREADYDGLAVGWGIGNTKASIEECAEACRQHVPEGDGPFGKLPCNAFAWCSAEHCFEPDAHKHGKGDCWLKFTEAPASPEVNMRGALSRAMRQRHPDAPERVQWHAGVLLPHGVKLTNGSWSPRHDW
ncbi:hypothetical protein ABPG77_005793 [Micractinium sp. CCAP 211/92]